MKEVKPDRGRPDLVAAERGGDWAQTMDGEGDPTHATMEQAKYWTQIYSEILGMEEKVLSRIRQLMATQSLQVQKEVELTNVPVVVAQAERFRQRLGYWQKRVDKLDGGANKNGKATVDDHAKLDGAAKLDGLAIANGHAKLNGRSRLEAAKKAGSL